MTGEWDRILAAAVAEHPDLAVVLTDLTPLDDAQGPCLVPRTARQHGGAVWEDAVTLVERLASARCGFAVRVRAPIQTARPTGSTIERQDAYRAAQEHPVVRLLGDSFAAEVVAREPSDPASFQRRLADGSLVRRDP